MSPIAGFSRNPFITRADTQSATIALLKASCQYQSPGGARIRLPVTTGTHFDETAAQLEGYARPLWAIGALLAGASKSDHAINQLSAAFARGLANGTDPDHEEYWGPVVLRDQRMVEMEIISFALLVAPDVFFHEQNAEVKSRIVGWLKSIIGKDMPATNWLWFRVMTILALIQVCGLPQQELCPLMEQDLEALDSFYLSEGWSSDGLWNNHGRQADYYSGSFAIQFSQLLFVKFAEEIDARRCQLYRERAANFASQFFRYFGQDGAAIPFGRSLTYRWAMGGFWAAAAYVGVALPAPLSEIGVVKGLLHRHLRWWARKPNIFNIDGTLNIGFLYPNMYMCEDYNSPQSVYWCMKSLLVLALADDHAFWASEELPLPTTTNSLAAPIKPAMQIVCDSGSHHFLLSAGQFCPWPLKATEAKYGKCAYSSHFGFSVPTGPLLQQIAPDSTLVLSFDDGDSWYTKWIPIEPHFSNASLVMADGDEDIPTLVSSWKPSRHSGFTVTTALIAPSKRWPDWHVRVHKFHDTSGRTLPQLTTIVEGAFAVPGRKSSNGLPISPIPLGDLTNLRHNQLPVEAISATSYGSLVCSSAGTSGIQDLRSATDGSSVGPEDVILPSRPEPSILKPDANTNLIWPRTVIPILKSVIPEKALLGSKCCFLVTGVFAMAQQRLDTIERWCDLPVVCLGDEEPPSTKPFIRFRKW